MSKNIDEIAERDRGEDETDAAGQAEERRRPVDFVAVGALVAGLVFLWADIEIWRACRENRLRERETARMECPAGKAGQDTFLRFCRRVEDAVFWTWDRSGAPRKEAE